MDTYSKSYSYSWRGPVIFVGALAVIFGLLLIGKCAMAADGICPICGKVMEFHVDWQDNIQFTPSDFNLGAVPLTAIVSGHRGTPFIDIDIPMVCDECREKYGKDVEKSIKREFDYWWQGIVKENDDNRKARDLERKQDELRYKESQVKELEEQIKKLKEE